MLQLLTEQEVADILRVSVHKLRRDRNVGGGVPFIKLGGAVRYSQETIEQWLKGKIYDNTSQFGNA